MSCAEHPSHHRRADNSATALVRPVDAASRAARRLLALRRGATELAILLIVYVAYSASRLLASDDVSAAGDRARGIVDIEKAWHIDIEGALNHLVYRSDTRGVVSSFWYATAHYLVTAVVLFWLYRRRGTHYLTARRALVLATACALALYLAFPTAPPRLLGGDYVDILSVHSQAGWWGSDASAPRGMGDLTNQLAAMPSLHAGWSLWVAIVLFRTQRSRAIRVLGAAYAAITATVIIGTANHWVVDVIGGWAVVASGFVVVLLWGRNRSTVRADDVVPRPSARRSRPVRPGEPIQCGQRSFGPNVERLADESLAGRGHPASGALPPGVAKIIIRVGPERSEGAHPPEQPSP